MPVREALHGVLIEVKNVSKAMLKDDRGLFYHRDRHITRMAKLTEQIQLSVNNYRKSVTVFNDQMEKKLQALQDAMTRLEFRRLHD